MASNCVYDGADFAVQRLGALKPLCEHRKMRFSSGAPAGNTDVDTGRMLLAESPASGPFGDTSASEVFARATHQPVMYSSRRRLNRIELNYFSATPQDLGLRPALHISQ